MFTYDYPHRDAFEDAKKHARMEFPKESCGVIVKGKYVPCSNIAEDPLKDFLIDPVEIDRYFVNGTIQVIVHSHPNGPYYPSKADMTSQMASNLPWAIIVLDEERTAPEPIIWGTPEPMLDILGRPFLHGVTDCYSMVRDVFRLGKDKLALQGIEEWPYDPIELYDLPRDDAWWHAGDNFYMDHYADQGFVQIDNRDARPGDCFMIKIRSNIVNHAGVLVGNGQVAHHLPMRLSRREPVSIWGFGADHWLRYEGKK